jgi:hypothetical protein
VPVFWLFTADGFHVPLIPLSDGVYNVGTGAPAQMVKDVPKANDGTITGLMVTVKVVDVAHCPGLGVKVYIPEFWLSIVAGLHVPLMPLVDVPGKTGTAEPAQYVCDEPKANVGVTFGLIVTVSVVVVAHCPASGVKM